MKLGIYLRNMGAVSTRECIHECALAADRSAVDDLWVVDHIAIPPDEAEGSDGRYLDPLATLAYLAACTSRVALGVGVLVLPYRPALATAKWIATIQTLSAERLLLGVGVGWMAAEFRATGVDRRRRGAITDETLEQFERFFAADLAESNGQPFLFRPRPSKPPIIVGGAPGFAIDRTVRFGDGWMPGRLDDDALRDGAATLCRRMSEAGRGAPEIINLTTLPLDDVPAAVARAHALAALGVTRIAHMGRYDDAAGFRRAVDALDAVAESLHGS